MKIKTLIIAAVVSVSQWGFSQGFVNLNFESAILITDSSQGYPFVFATNAIPGWIPYLGGTAQSYVASNGLSLGGAQVNIEGTNNGNGFAPIQGKYFILLQGAGFGTVASAAIGQTGVIPSSAQSLYFWGALGNMLITFNGQPLIFNSVGGTANYNIYTADVSPFSGQIGELLFTAPFKSSGRIDNIQFSTVAVPEPGTLALAALGTMLLGFRRWQK